MLHFHETQTVQALAIVVAYPWGSFGLGYATSTCNLQLATCNSQLLSASGWWMDCLFDWLACGLASDWMRLAWVRLSLSPALAFCYATHAKLFPPLPLYWIGPSLFIHAPCLFALVCLCLVKSVWQPLGAAFVRSGGQIEQRGWRGRGEERGWDSWVSLVHRQRWLLIDAHAHDMPHISQSVNGLRSEVETETEEPEIVTCDSSCWCCI